MTIFLSAPPSSRQEGQLSKSIVSVFTPDHLWRAINASTIPTRDPPFTTPFHSRDHNS
jgi:hypothetical protein